MKRVCCRCKKYKQTQRLKEFDVCLKCYKHLKEWLHYEGRERRMKGKLMLLVLIILLVGCQEEPLKGENLNERPDSILENRK